MGVTFTSKKIWKFLVLLLAAVLLSACTAEMVDTPEPTSPGVLRTIDDQTAVALMELPAPDSVIIDLAADGEEIIIVWAESTDEWLYVATPRLTMGYIPAENCQIQGIRPANYSAR